MNSFDDGLDEYREHEREAHPDDDHINPECRAGKHSNCDEAAWCTLADTITTCKCPHHDLPEKG